MRLKKWMVLLTSVDEMKLFRSERTKCERRTKKKEYKRYNIKNHFWWWKIIKKCNCYLGECAESDHYLLSSPYFLRTSPAIRVMKGKSINFFLFFIWNTLPAILSSHRLPHTRDFQLQTSEAAVFNADGSKKGLLNSSRKKCKTCPNPVSSALRDENMAVKYKYFYANHIICSFLHLLPLSFVNQLTLFSAFKCDASVCLSE